MKEKLYFSSLHTAPNTFINIQKNWICNLILFNRVYLLSRVWCWNAYVFVYRRIRFQFFITLLLLAVVAAVVCLINAIIIILNACMHLTGTLKNFPRMLNLFAFYFKLDFKSSLHLQAHNTKKAAQLRCAVLRVLNFKFFFYSFGFSESLVFFIHFTKFLMLITARFTPSQNRL